MAQATDIKRAPVTVIAPSALALALVALAAIILAVALVVPSFTTAPAVQPRSEAVLEGGRAWQRQYEQMSGLEARREAQRQAAIDSGREWEQQYKDMFGE